MFLRGDMKLALLAFYSVLIMTIPGYANTVVNINKENVSFDKWEDGTNLRISKPDELKSINVAKINEKYSQSNADIELNVYSLTPKRGAENGGIEYEYVWKKKPASNKFSIAVNLDGLIAYYQPALTQEEINEGIFRPENVIGSYAVYHATKKNHRGSDTNYKAGKAFHIYRPKAVDSNGNWTWCEFNNDLQQTGTLITTCPQSFLDTAKYPVKI